MRYWSWLFAASLQRAPLLGMYALLAEWNALMDPATEASASHMKLGWWQEEIQRLIAHRPVHPICRYLAAQPRAGELDFSPLIRTLDAAMAEVSGVPLERSSQLEPQACALRAVPLRLASQLASEVLDEASLEDCLRSLAVADYLLRIARDYRRHALHGRVPFAVEDLLAAGVDNADLCADHPPPKLSSYLQELQARAAQNYAAAAHVLPDDCRAKERHLLVLAALGLKHLQRPQSALESARLQDMLLAWSTARRAARA